MTEILKGSIGLKSGNPDGLFSHILLYLLTDSFIFASVGFAAHLLEDALVFNPNYRILWPLSFQKFGIGVFKYKPDLYGVADKEVLAVGLILVGVCAIIRTIYEGKEWIKRSIS